MIIKIPKIFRILLIEDDKKRIDIFRTWLTEKTALVVASSAGAAIGVLERDNNRKNGRVYAGILLDHDLQDQVKTDIDRCLSGSNLIDVIIRNIFKDVPILIHSMNIHQSITMKDRLASAGYSITKIPMSDLTKEAFDNWIKEANEIWEELYDDNS